MLAPARTSTSRGSGLAAALSLGLLLTACVARAEPSTPWTPSLEARHALEFLADETDLQVPLTQWPLPRAAVVRALDALPRELPPATEYARARIAGELRDAAGPAFSAAVRNRGEALSGFGDEATPGSSLAIRSGALATPHVVAQLGARVDQGMLPSNPQAKLRLDDTAVAIEVLGTQLQAWAHRDWWGPGWQSSLLLGNNAPPLYGIGLQRAAAGRSESRWLSWLGPWTYDFFVARNDDPLDSFLVGTRITMRPFSLLEIALARTAQWGGRGHPQSLNSFLRMLIGRGVNANGTQESLRDPANEVSGFDLRLRCPGGYRCAAYTQLMGEDATHNMPSSFLGLYGLESWSANGRHRWFAEFVETICGMPLERKRERGCAYRNYAYPAGYTNAGRWIGSAAGADSTLLTLGWLDAEHDVLLRFHTGTIGARIGVFAFDGDPAHSGGVRGASLRKSWVWKRMTLGTELDWTFLDATLGRRQEARAGITLRMPL